MRLHRSYEMKQLEERTLMSRRYMRTFMRFADAWGLDYKAIGRLLGLTGLHAISGWKSSWQDLILTELQLEKVSYLLAINKLLMNRFDSDKHLQQWLNEPHEHPIFLGKTPMECFMISNSNQLRVISEWMLKEWD